MKVMDEIKLVKDVKIVTWQLKPQINYHWNAHVMWHHWSDVKFPHAQYYIKEMLVDCGMTN